MVWWQDIALARALSSYPSSSSSHPDIANQHGVDIIFGGHDHTYYIGHGAASWEGYERVEGEIGTEEDDGVLCVSPFLPSFFFLFVFVFVFVVRGERERRD